jgi:type I restriction-modification system DNA methylase subunit
LSFFCTRKSGSCRAYRSIIEDQCHKDAAFATKLKSWFVDQGWSFGWQDADFGKAARQTAYLLVNKILFYNLLQAKRPHELDPLEIPAGLTKSSMLQKTLQNYFDEVLKIDYETIYTTDFIDSVAFPDSGEVVAEINRLVARLRRYDFSSLGYDIVGRIFERLIPKEERHNLGQYFTSPDVVDLILRFCLQHEDDKVLDPACGAGTFLVRAYQHKKLMNQRKGHEEILETLWGNDIAKFPAHLSTINLAVNDLSVDHNYPNIIKEDFFALAVGEQGFDLPSSVRRRRAVTLGKNGREVTYPRWFDVIVGNPPYTRQEEIPQIGVDKSKLIEHALWLGNHRIADISRRAGIHAYFFVHGTKFLKDGGRFGFIVSNSWLDVDYGKGLQEFFLQSYKIVAIIESKVERWFEAADVNTCIVILEKCRDKTARNANPVRFVYLKRPLRHFVPPAQEMWDKKVDRLRAIDDFRNTVLYHNSLYENEDLRVFPVRQTDLWKEGFDREQRRFTGAKWGKYLRAPQVFFTIQKKAHRVLVPLREVAEVRFGVKTGANEFFYMTEETAKARRIESRWLQPVLFSLKEVRGYEVSPEGLRLRGIICHKTRDELAGTGLLKYIESGERKGFSRRPTCAARNPWYDLASGWAPAPLVFPAKVGERMPVLVNAGVLEDKKFYGIVPGRQKDCRLIAALMNSTLSRFFIEFSCRQLTGAQAIADVDVAVVESLPIPDPGKLPAGVRRNLRKAFADLATTEAESVFREVAASPDEVALDKVKPARRRLDEIVMGEVLGLDERQQMEVYRSLVDLVRSRLDRADSVDKDRMMIEGIDIEALRDTIVDRVKEE